MVDILFCQINLSTLGILETQTFQKAKSQYLKLQCIGNAIWHFHLKIILKTLTNINSQFPD